MRSRAFAVALVASVALTSAPAYTSPAAAADSVSSTVGTYLPIVLWAVTGTVLGAVAWPLIVGGGAAGAGITSVGALANPGAVIGTIAGAGGYLLTR